MVPQINNPHDWALWLLENLEDQHALAPGHTEGRLPVAWDFGETVAAIGIGGQLIGLSDETARTIEFHPPWAGVFASLEEMFTYPDKLRNAPPRFTLRDINFTYDAQAVQQLALPPQVANYLSAVKLCGLLPLMADMAASNGALQYFIKSPESRLEVKLSYRAEDLTPLPSLSLFETQFAVTASHKDQKRSIVRAVLLDAFKGKKTVTVGEIFHKFEDIVEDVRSNYAMYAAEFSFERIKAEVEKDNLDSTLKLNKTLSEIQNQLLAMPVALVLVGSQMTPDTALSIKNVVIWLGAFVFAGLMIMLIRNQRHAIDAITEEIRLRKVKVDAQPEGMAGKFKCGFDDLQKRALTQTRTLSILRGFVILSIVLATGLLIWYSNPEFHRTTMTGAPSQPAIGAAAVASQPSVFSGATATVSVASKPKSPAELAVQDMRSAHAAPTASTASAPQKN